MSATLSKILEEVRLLPPREQRQLRSQLDAIALYVARITGVEITAALTRKERGGRLSAADATSALSLFQHDYANRLRPVEISAALIAEAMKAARKHGLRGYDAVQLAASIHA